MYLRKNGINQERVDEEADRFWETLPLETQSRLANAFRVNHENMPNPTLGPTPQGPSRSASAPPRSYFITLKFRLPLTQVIHLFHLLDRILRGVMQFLPNPCLKYPVKNGTVCW